MGNKFSNHLPTASSHRAPSPVADTISAPVEVVEGPSPAPSPRIAKAETKASVSKPAHQRPNQDESVAVQTIKLLPHVRKSVRGMDFSQEEVDHMIEFYDVMASANEKLGVKAWEKKANEVCILWLIASTDYLTFV